MEKVSGALQENILILLVFDDQYCKLIRNSIDVDLFDSAVLKDIVARAVSYQDQFGTAPKEHIADLLDDALNDKDKRKAALYEDVLRNLYDAKKDVNAEYVINSLSSFVRQQNLKSGLMSAVKMVQTGDLDGAEIEMQKCLTEELQLFDPGTFISDSVKSLSFLNSQSINSFPTGVPALDDRGLGPARKTLHLFAAPPKRGKTWWLIHLAKQAMMHRSKVCHVTLEMSEEAIMQRYMQSLFSISKRKTEVEIPQFVLDDLGRFISIDFDDLEDRPHYQDKKIRKFLNNKLRKAAGRLRLVVKQFPTGALTVNGLKAYLDALERMHKYIPDLLIVDYPDLMYVDPGNYRLHLGQIYKDLRGLAIERNIAVAAVSQNSRSSVDARLSDERAIAEDFSKIATVDCLITYNQTLQEKQLNLARLFVAVGRNDEDKFTVLISQAYALGQFCLDSVRMNDRYWQQLTDLSSGLDEEDAN